jgi:hypothetical protein
MPVPRGQQAVYEVTIAGALGEAVRAALPPHAAGPPRARTTLRTAAMADADLVDLVSLLHRHGFDIEGVTRVRAR